MIFSKQKIKVNYFENLKTTDDKDKIADLSLVLQSTDITNKEIIFHTKNLNDVYRVLDFCRHINYELDSKQFNITRVIDSTTQEISSRFDHEMHIRSPKLLANMKKMGIVPDWKKSSCDIFEHIKPNLQLQLLLNMADFENECILGIRRPPIITANSRTAEHAKIILEKALDYKISVEKNSKDHYAVYYDNNINPYDIFYYIQTYDWPNNTCNVKKWY